MLDLTNSVSYLLGINRMRNMSQTTKKLRESTEHALDMLEMASFNEGFEAAVNAVDQLSDELHNTGDTTAAEVLRWVAKELRGENC
jgi:soluble cytochrome b562